MSGIDTRSGFRKRSNSRSNLSGQTSVIRSAYATSDPAAEPRPGPDRDAAVARRLDEVGDDEEVAGVARLRDDAELVVEPLLHFGGQRGRRSARARPPSRASRAARSRVATPGGQRERRDVVLLRELDARPRRRSGACSRARRGGPGSARAISVCALEVQARGRSASGRVAAILAEPDAEQDVVRVVVVARAGSARRWSRRPAGPSSSASLKISRVELGLALGVVRLHLEVVAVLEDVGVPRARPRARRRSRPPSGACATSPARHAERDDQPFAVLREQLAVDARLGVEAFGVGERRELDEVPVARHVPREQHQVVVRLRARRRRGRVARRSPGATYASMPMIGLSPPSSPSPGTPTRRGDCRGR